MWITRWKTRKGGGKLLVNVVTGGFVVLDLITGLVKAFKEKNYDSSVMREGLYHKAGSIIFVVFAHLLDYAQSVVDLGVTVPVTTAVCTYVILMEVGSIIENLSVINPEIVPEKIRGYFKKLNVGE